MKTGKLILSMAALLWLAACTSTSDPAPVTKTDLIAAIAAANVQLTTTFEGVAAGNFIKGSQQPLADAVEIAQTIVDNTAATQTMVNNGTVAMNAATATYLTMIVTPIDPTNLVGQWTFDQVAALTPGTVVKDYSGNNRDGTLKTGHTFWGGMNVTYSADRYGIANKALHFDGGSNVEIPYNSNLNPPSISISLWLKQDVQGTIYPDQYMIAMNRWNGYKFQMQGTPRAFFTATYDSPPAMNQCCYNFDNDVTLPQGVWYHVVVTFGNGNIVFYANGVMTKTWPNPGTVSPLSNPVNLVFGQDLPTTGYSLSSADPNYLNWGGYFVGAMDEIRIYKSILSASQVTSIYDAEKP